MKPSGRLLAVCAPLGLATLASATAPALADDDDDFWRGFRGGRTPICEHSADSMLRACLFDLGDTQHTTLANCLNIEDPAERLSCFGDARDTRREDLGECFAVHEARTDACELLGENRYADPLESDTTEFVDPGTITHGTASPYVSLVAGHTYVLLAGEDGEETVVVHVTDETREILDIQCRVVKDVVLEFDESEYELVEYTDDWFAQDVDANVYYCGEVARNYEDGVLRDLDGSFEAGIEFAKAGELVRAIPLAGDAHRQEYALGEAEDIVQYVASGVGVPAEGEGGENDAFPCDSSCLKTREFAPLEPEASEFKYYRPGVGFVLAVGMEDGELTGEREELVCVGSSLEAVLADDVASCGLDDPAALRETLCEADRATFESLCP